MQSQTLAWTPPLELASSIEEPHWILLYSGVQTSYSGRYSYLAHQLDERITSDGFGTFSEVLSEDQPTMHNAWFGYMGYGLKDELENVPADTRYTSIPNLCMMKFKCIYQFDHVEKRITRWSLDNDIPLLKPRPYKASSYPIRVYNLTSNMSRESYLEKVSHIISRIHSGDLYQANLTRKFTGSFDTPPQGFLLFKALCEVSPAPYSAYIQDGHTSVLSSSPELFLDINANGLMRTRPIKGTSPRYPDPQQDQKSRCFLEKSDKDRAENLMIVDLMRNDFSRACVPGSVQTSSLYEVTSHANVHHMSGTITGQKHPNTSSLDAIKCCFPPGSMTGAPKIEAIHLCSELENLERGVYSGAIGWLGGDGSCELSVVIRTLIINGKTFEFQVGGGIVADSSPEKELQELKDKASGLLHILNLSATDIDRL